MPPKNKKNKKGDLALISFPKSGRTWLRVMLDSSALNKKYSIDHGKVIAGRFQFSEIKTHRIKDVRCIYLLRNPIDTAVSYYYHRIYRDGLKYNGSIDDFCLENVDPIVQHHNAVINADWKDLCIIQYEKLKTDGFNELKKIFAFANVDISKDEIRNMISVGDFNKMKNYHKDHRYMGRGYRLVASNGKPQAMKVRKGIMYGYRDELKKETIKQLYAKCENFKYKDKIRYFEGL